LGHLLVFGFLWSVDRVIKPEAPGSEVRCARHDVESRVHLAKQVP